MIKITVNPHHESKSYCFDIPVIVVGDGSPDAVNICFPCEGLHQNHLKIIKMKDGYWVVNQSNDPFVTLNGQPFGKKKLEAGDLLQIRDHQLIIDDLSMLSLPPTKPVEHATQQLEKSEFLNFPDVENLANAENPEAWFPTDLAEIEPVHKEEKTRAKPTLKKKIQFSYDWKKKALKLALTAFVLLIALLGILATEIYLRATKQNDKEEMLAAESLSDYAMALTYAKVFHVAPQKQNWVDPQFIKNILFDILSSSSIPCSNIDMQGHFSNCDYMLRFYTNRDFSRFLLIAQPAPNLAQWLIPKSSFIVDSDLMKIHKIHDLRIINRLLSNPNPLEGENGNEVLIEIGVGKVIQLKTLAEKLNKKDFAPPLALHYLKPGAENLIYNAPRYHQLGGTFLKAVHTPEQFRVAAFFQSEIDAISRFKNLVFYSPEGIQYALEGYQALRSIGFPQSFFVGHLLYSPKGEILNSHIVLESSPDKLIDDSHDIAKVEDYKNHYSTHPDEGDEQIVLLLKEITYKLHNSLGPILHNLHSQLKESVENENFYLTSTFYHLTDLYDSHSQIISEELENGITALRRKIPQLTENKIERYLREYGLRDFYHNIAIKSHEKRDFTPTFAFFQPTYSFLQLNRDLSLQKKWSALQHVVDLSRQPSHIPYKDCPGARCILR